MNNCKKIVKNSKLRNLALSTFAIALILASTIAALMMPLAQGLEYPTFAFIAASPDPVGVNQNLAVIFWLGDAPPTAAGPTGDRWQNMKVTVTKPDGTTEVMGPYKSDPVGTAFLQYTPTVVGKYSFQMSFPGQWINTSTYQRWYMPSTTKVTTVTVQQAPAKASPDLPPPTDYWTRPIDSSNRQWYSIAGNWLMAKYDKDAVGFEGSGNWNPYTTAPDTAHIVWTKELTQGGIIGGSFGYGMGYYTGLQYEPLLRPPIIINGVLYTNTANPPRYGFQANDLRTGEVLWYQNSSHQLSFGQTFFYDSPNQHGAIAYLWSIDGGVWYMFDAFTGNQILAISGVPSASYLTMGPNGEVLVYNLNANTKRLVLWNSTKAIPVPSGGGANDWMWRPDNFRGQTLNGTVGIQWNVTVPNVPRGSSLQWYYNGILVSHAVVTVPDQAWPIIAHVGYDAKTGAVLWTQNRTDMGMLTYPIYLTPNEGTYAVFVREKKQWYAFDVATGVQVWKTDPIENDWAYYEYTGGFAYGKFYSAGYDGSIHSYNAKTGAHLWDFNIGTSGLDAPYGSWPIFGATIFADNKIFVATNEHSPSQPLWMGERLYAVDAETGKLVWNVTGMYAGGRNGLGAIADGYFVTANGYDNRIYCFGKGLTATTVEVQNDVIDRGQTVLIKGTVLDQSPGAKNTAAIADEDVTPWMEYIYMQKQMPTNVKGVPVHLTALDSNGNTEEIGIATSDKSGFYSILWKPPIEGKYTITASFKGSKAYWQSSAETAIGVLPASTSPIVQPTAPPSATAPTTTAPATFSPVPSPSPSTAPPPTTGAPTVIYTAIGAAIAVVVIAAAALILRKRK